MQTSDNKIESIVWLLFIAVFLFTILLIVVAKFMSSDGQTFQIVAGLVTGFSGALLMRIKPKNVSEDNGTLIPDHPKIITTKETKEVKAEAGDIQK